MKKILLVIFGSFLLFCGSCSKNVNTSPNPVPSVYVSLTINLDNPLYYELGHQGGADTLDGVGNKGIIVVHDFSDNYWAYDRTCPYHINSACGKICMGSLTLLCGHRTGSVFHPCCASEYTLDGGAVTKGPSTFPLKRYNVTISGNMLTITN